MFSGPNPLDPDRMPAGERLDELASILALGLIRLRSRQSSKLSGKHGNSSVDFRTAESVCRNHSHGEFRT